MLLLLVSLSIIFLPKKNLVTQNNWQDKRTPETFLFVESFKSLVTWNPTVSISLNHKLYLGHGVGGRVCSGEKGLKGYWQAGQLARFPI